MNCMRIYSGPFFYLEYKSPGLSNSTCVWYRKQCIMWMRRINLNCFSCFIRVLWMRKLYSPEYEHAIHYDILGSYSLSNWFSAHEVQNMKKLRSDNRFPKPTSKSKSTFAVTLTTNVRSLIQIITSVIQRSAMLQNMQPQFGKWPTTPFPYYDIQWYL